MPTIYQQAILIASCSTAACDQIYAPGSAWPAVTQPTYRVHMKHKINQRNPHTQMSSQKQYYQESTPRFLKTARTLEMFSNKNYPDELQDTELKR